MSKQSVILLGFLAWVVLSLVCVWTHLPEIVPVQREEAASTNEDINKKTTAELGVPSLKVAVIKGKAQLIGILPNDGVKQLVIARAREVYGKGNYSDQLTIAEVADPKWLSSALALFPFVQHGVTNGILSIEGDRISLAGQVLTDEVKMKIYQDAIAAAPNVKINNLLLISGEKPLTDEQVATQVAINEHIIGKSVEFEKGKDSLTEPGKMTLEELVPIFQKSTDHFEISGHTDNVGSEANNASLSLRRAQTVKKYLVEKGLDGNRLTPAGYGQNVPVADNATAEGKQRNRRIEFQLRGGN
jgi:OOP family OmpA-OmpF porin